MKNMKNEKRIIFWKWVIPILILGTFFACKKLENAALNQQGVNTASSSLSIMVMNLKNNQPEAGVKLFISRKISAKGEYQLVDTGRTDATGTYKFAAPIPNDYKAFLDTMFYTGDTASLLMATTTPGSITLKTRPKFGMAPIELSVLDSATKQAISNFDMAISYRPTSKPNFIVVGNEKTDASGKIILSLPWPSVVKAKVLHDEVYKKDSVLINHFNDNGTTAAIEVPTLASFSLNLFDAADQQYVADASVKFSIKPQGAASFGHLADKLTDGDGNTQVFAAFPSSLRVELSNHRFFKDTVFEISISKYSSIAKAAALYLKPPAYTEPVLTNLQVTTLSLNNGLTLNGPQDVTTDRKGNVYISDAGNNRIIKVAPNGNTTVLAGSGTAGMTDGQGATASFAQPYGLRVAKDGSIYVANNSSSPTTFNAIRKISIAPNGTATVNTIAGKGAAGGANGAGTDATFNRAAGLALDKANRYLYTAEWSGHRVRRIDLTTNEVSTVAGTGTSGVEAGVGTAAKFQFPWGLALDDTDQHLYVASWNGTGLHKIELASTNVSLIRKGATTGFNQPRGIYVSPGGKIMVANTSGHYISMVNNLNELGTSTFSILAGSSSGNVNGAALAAKFSGPIGLWYDPYTGNWYVVDATNNQIRIIRSNDI